MGKSVEKDDMYEQNLIRSSISHVMSWRIITSDDADVRQVRAIRLLSSESAASTVSTAFGMINSIKGFMMTPNTI